MTQIEATDNGSAAVPAEAAVAASVGAKWQADYHSALLAGNDALVKVADAAPAQDGGQDAAPSGGDQKFGVKELVAIDAKDLPPSLRIMQGLADHFDKADDKAKALGEVKAEIEKTIAAADATFTPAQRQVEADTEAFQPKYEAAETMLDAAKTSLQAIIEKGPKADRQHVVAELNLMVDDKTSPAVKRAIEAELGKQPGLLPAARAFVRADEAAQLARGQVQELSVKMERAVEEPLMARIVYADMLEQCGDKDGAKQIQAEAMALEMGMTIEQFRQLQQQQKGASAKPGDN